MTGAVGPVAYRFDFFEVSDLVCGEAASAMDPTQGMARAWATSIPKAITAPHGGRARMPPAPAAPLAEWERLTLVRWAEQPFPSLGLPDRGNRRPVVSISAPRLANARLGLTVLVEDPDGEPVLGVLTVGDTVLRMDRAGSFTTILDTSQWPDGRYPIGATLCDGWGSAAYRLGVVDVVHSEAALSAVTFFSGGGRTPTPPSSMVPVPGSADAGAAGSAAAAPAGASPAPSAPWATSVTSPSQAPSPPRPDAAPDAVALAPPPLSAPAASAARATGACPGGERPGEPGCPQSMARNPDFSREVAPWSGEPAIELAFSAEDAEGRPGSGSVSVINSATAQQGGVSMAGARQCVPFATTGGLDLRAHVRLVGPGDGAAQAAVNVTFHEDPSCGGSASGSFTSTRIAERDVWRVVEGQLAPPPGTRALALRLVVVKPFPAPPVQATFDNIFVRTR